MLSAHPYSPLHRWIRAKGNSEQERRGFFWWLPGEFRDNNPASEAVFPSVLPSHFIPAGPLRALTGPSAHLVRVWSEFGPTAPTSAGQLTLRRQQVAQSK